MVPPPYAVNPELVPSGASLVIIGMAAAGKTTIGQELASLLGMPQMDTDHIIEAHYGTDLHSISKGMSKEAFLDLECAVIMRLNLKQCVISTGGSVVYRPQAVRHLKTMGPLIHISVPLPLIMERIARKPERGLAIDPGQTLEDLYNERAVLYAEAADFTVQGGTAPAAVYADKIACMLSLP
ncbi:MAG: shikimate kinase [Desulfovibrio sp.]|jgi:shikimate kinase|nr:shikimate kinase [Desulfovibrio sp.]